MRSISLMAALFLFSLTARSQNQPEKNPAVTVEDDRVLYAKVSNDICACLNALPDKSHVIESFGDCADKGMEPNKEAVIKFLVMRSSDTSYNKGYEVGQWLAQRLTPTLIDSCDIFYQGMLSLVEKAAPFSDPDSIKSQLTRIELMLQNGDSANNILFYKGLLLFKLKNYAAAAEACRNADRVLANPSVIVFALVMDRKEREKNSSSSKQSSGF